MKKTAILFFAGFILCGPSWAGAYSAPDSLEMPEQLNDWMSHFYLHRDTSKVVPAIREMFKQGWFQRETAVAPLAAFWASVFYQNHKQVDLWLRELNDLEVKQKKYLWMAVRLSGIPETAELLAKMGQENGAEAADYIRELLAEKRENVVDMTILGPEILDMFWAQFVASGDERCVRRVIGALYYVQETDDLAKILIGGAARWSLESNAVQHPRVLEICKQARAGQPVRVRKILDEIIKKAEKDYEKLK